MIKRYLRIVCPYQPPHRLAPFLALLFVTALPAIHLKKKRKLPFG
jgi:hypothetical protein